MEQNLHPVLSVRLFTDEKCFGPGVAALLTLVKTCHSLRAAAMEMGMAYSKAWTILKNAEEQLGFKLLLSTTAASTAAAHSSPSRARPFSPPMPAIARRCATLPSVSSLRTLLISFE